MIGNEVIPKTLFDAERDGSSVFMISESLNFLLKYCKFKECLKVRIFLWVKGNKCEKKVEKGRSKAAGEAKELLVDMILKQNSPEHERLRVLVYAINLFESNQVKFTPEEIHAFTDQLSVIENSMKYGGK